jgi:uncharacterized protein YdeI (YjbR/CyaY-like superfamily)
MVEVNPAKFEQVEITTPEMLWDWLDSHHAQPNSVWLVTWKAVRPDLYVSRDAVLDALIAYGWIDGRRMKRDEVTTMQLISPRKQQSWAATYKERAARLEAEGRMLPAGQAVIERDRKSGLWDLLGHVDDLVVPAELSAAMDRLGASDWWNKAAPSYRRNVLRWIAIAKRPDTRALRIASVADYAARKEKVPQY